MDNGDAWGFTFDDKVSAIILLNTEASFAHNLAQLGKSQMAQFEAMMSKTTNQDALEHYADEGAELATWMDAAADLSMVATYHWAEKTLKTELIFSSSKKRDKKKARSMGILEVATKLEQKGRPISKLPSFSLVTGTLRLFSNSWKHNADEVAENLWKDIRPSTTAKKPSRRLADEAMRNALATKAQLATASTANEIATGFASLTHKLLIDIVNTRPD